MRTFPLPDEEYLLEITHLFIHSFIYISMDLQIHISFDGLLCTCIIIYFNAHIVLGL